MRLAVVLTSVGSTGAVQAGLLVALAERGLRPSLFVGSSAGAVNAVCMAARGADRAAAVRLAALWSSTPATELFPFSPAGALVGVLGGRGHVLPPGPLRARIERHLPVQRLEDAPVPVHLVAADARTGEPRVLDRGPALDALMASAALPGLLPAVRWDRWALLDGSLAAPGALSHALAIHDGAVLVLGRPDADVWRPRGVAGVAVRTVSMLAGRQLASDLAHGPPRVTVLSPPPVDPADFSHPGELVDYGRAEGRRLLAAL